MKKSKVFLALAAVLLIVVCCSAAGCTTSEPDPIVGTFVTPNTVNIQQPTTNNVLSDNNDLASESKESQVGTISHSEVILKFYENHTVLKCSIADKRVIHTYFQWIPKGNLSYEVNGLNSIYEFILSNDFNELTLIKLNSYDVSTLLIRNDSYVIPPHYDTHIPHYDIHYNNSENQGKI